MNQGLTEPSLLNIINLAKQAKPKGIYLGMLILNSKTGLSVILFNSSNYSYNNFNILPNKRNKNLEKKKTVSVQIFWQPLQYFVLVRSNSSQMLTFNF